MNLTTKIMFGLAILLGVLSFIPNESLLIVKVIIIILLLITIFINTRGGLISKKIQVFVEDIKEDRRNDYRTKISQKLQGLGEIKQIEENYHQVALQAEGKIKTEDIIKYIKKCNLKTQLQDIIVLVRYTSLEAKAETVITIQASATPNSMLKIQGLSSKIDVGYSGNVEIQIPKSLYLKNVDKGFIAATCIKGNLKDEIKISL